MSVKPFAEAGHYTTVHDAVFDVVMPFCPPNAFKVLMFVLRKTRGWKKERDALSYSQIKAGTGIKSDTTLSKEIGWLVDKKLLNATDADGGDHPKGARRVPSYSLNRDFSLKTTPENGGNKKAATPENGVVATPENGDYKNQTNKNHSASNEAAPDGAPAEKKQRNWFAFYCELANTLNVTICPEDRTRTSKQLKDVVEKEGATEEEMYRVVSKILEASANGYDLSAQKALQKVRGNNVTQLRPEPEPYRRPSIRV